MYLGVYMFFKLDKLNGAEVSGRKFTIMLVAADVSEDPALVPPYRRSSKSSDLKNKIGRLGFALSQHEVKFLR